SVVLDPAALLKQSTKRRLALYGVGGLLAGLLLGLGGVILGAILSNRLRRRDEIAAALGAPIKLSTGKVSRGRLRRVGLDTAQDKNLSRVVVQLGNSVAPTSGNFAGLAVVPVDDVNIAAISLASLAIQSAREGLRVVFADLCPGAPGAKLLGVTEVGLSDAN